MSVGAICFTSSGSNGACWVGLVFPRLFFFFFGKMGFFSPSPAYAKKKSLRDLHKKEQISVEKKRDLRQKKSYATYALRRAPSLATRAQYCAAALWARMKGGKRSSIVEISVGRLFIFLA